VSASTLSLPRKLLFAAILATAALAVSLGGLEAALRLMHYGHSTHFFQRTVLANGDKIWRENRWCTAPYFSEALVRRPLPVRLPEKKTAGTYRIFVLGSSAAMGDPEPSFSLARMLGAMLRAAYPHQRFEVINAAVTAINSHVVRGIAEDCAKLEPDLFVVYEGNNEVIGPFGPAGVFAPFLQGELAVRVASALKTSRTGQLLSNLANRKRPAEWGGMEMFLRQQIGIDDPRLKAVRAHFRANLEAIAQSGHAAGASVFLCTVATNQRDFAPFLSQHRKNLSPAELTAWNTDLAEATDALRKGDLSGAEAAYRAAYAIDDHHAELAFRFGRLALQIGRDLDARDLLQHALDCDTLRFRTDAALNQVVRELGKTVTPPVEVVDLATALAHHSAHGITGDELLYEHVHLTFRGTYEAALALFPRIAADLARRGLVSGEPPTPFDYEEARLRLGYNIYEQAMITQELLNRFHKPPFTGQADITSRQHTWAQRAEQANQLLSRPDATPALASLAKRAIDAAPDDWLLARNTGAMLVARGDPASALPLLERASQWIDDDVDTLVALGRAQRALGQQAEAEATFAKARLLEPHYPGLPEAGSQRP